jgi:hypothetical protein|tara:strand:- start:627 stop:737 length:111 start_codon:yes stop_codon:yes gene_type:complete
MFIMKIKMRWLNLKWFLGGLFKKKNVNKSFIYEEKE